MDSQKSEAADPLHLLIIYAQPWMDCPLHPEVEDYLICLLGIQGKVILPSLLLTMFLKLFDRLTLCCRRQFYIFEQDSTGFWVALKSRVKDGKRMGPRTQAHINVLSVTVEKVWESIWTCRDMLVKKSLIHQQNLAPSTSDSNLSTSLSGVDGVKSYNNLYYNL